MLRFKYLMVGACITGALAASPSYAAELITNGGFSNGLTNWSIYTTANGTVGTATTSSFNVTGTGATQAARLQVGEINYTFAPPAGGGISQQFLVDTTGLINFSAAIAAFSTERNADFGIFSILVDGVVGDTYDFGSGVTNETKRSDLNFSQVLTAGSHTLSLQAVRPYLTAANTPFQYFTNVSAQSGSAVPEPATWAMMLVGFGGIGLGMRRRRNSSLRCMQIA